MAVNLSRHGDFLSRAYNEVLNGNTDTNWVLFTYDGNSNDIKVATKGDGGLDEMVQELNSAQVMYAFCRVLDPNLRVHKFVLINWTGEAVKGVRRGVCVKHIQPMANFLRGAHVTINAYSEDDVDPDLIMSKVSQDVGMNYSTNAVPTQNNTSASRPVGTVYQKSNALEEIDGTERERFWAQMEKEEQSRREQERKKAEEERQRAERERTEQDERETAERERRQRERANQIKQQRLYEKKQEVQNKPKRLQEPEREIQAAQVKAVQSSRSHQGTAYQKTRALEEINGTERDRFWAQMEKEEQSRREQERKKAEVERQRAERERIEQDERETAERERRQRERANQIKQQRLYEKKQEVQNKPKRLQEPEREIQAAQVKAVQSSRSHQGTAYQKTRALEEINGTERDRFWAQMEKEEQSRREQERKKAEEERQRAERERIEQDERETAERERRQRERANQIKQQRLYEKKQEVQNKPKRLQEPEREIQAAQVKAVQSSRSHQGTAYQKTRALEEINGTERDRFWAQMEKEEQSRREQERKKAEEERQRAERERIEQDERETAERERRQRERANQIKQQRLYEKKQEEQNKANQLQEQQEHQASQWKGIKSSRSVQEADDAAKVISQRALNPRDIFLQKERSFSNGDYEYQPGGVTEEQETSDDTIPTYRPVSKQDNNRTVEEQQGVCARALYDYQAADVTEITFDPDDIITNIDMIDDGWWRGYGPDGHYGMFPANYVELI